METGHVEREMTGGGRDIRKGVRPLSTACKQLETRDERATQSATRKQQAKHHWQREILQQEDDGLDSPAAQEQA